MQQQQLFVWWGDGR